MSNLDFYDLKPLASKHLQYQFDNAAQTNTYYVSFCNDIKDDAKRCAAKTMVTSYPFG